jgi:TonB family protein
MLMLAAPAFIVGLLLTGAPRSQTVDEPVADVAAFYLETCAGVPARETHSCEAGVAQNRARISASLYLGRVELGRFYSVRGQKSVFRSLPYDAATGRAGVELNFVLGAEAMAEAPDACLALGEPGRNDYWHRIEATLSAAAALVWQKRIDQLLARVPTPAMNIEVLFRLTSASKVGAIGPCAIGEALLLRLLDGDTGEILGVYEGPRLPPGVVPPRPMHATLRGDSFSGDPRSTYLATVQGQISRRLPPKTSPGNPVVTVRLTIGEDGAVVRDEVTRSSGDTRIDQLVADSVRRASPLPPPPPALRREIKEGGLVIEFHP